MNDIQPSLDPHSITEQIQTDREYGERSRLRLREHCKWAADSQVFLKRRDPYLIEIRKIGCNTREARGHIL